MDLTKLLQPIRKKWVYHFMVSPKTNLIEKPDWYLNQSLKWTYEFIDCIEAEQVDDKASLRKKLILEMLSLAHMRLSKDMAKISLTIDEDQHSEAILIHTYNEVVQFVKIIRRLLGDRYEKLSEKHDLMGVFADRVLFERIAQIEWEYAKKNLREILLRDDTWEPVLEGNFNDFYGIPRCVDRFLLQIKSITERIECFRQDDCQFSLIDLQCTLFVRLLTFMKKSEPSRDKNIISDMFFLQDESKVDPTRLTRVFNGINFLRLILKDRCFIPPDVIPPEELKSKLDKITREYVNYYDELIAKVHCNDR